MRILIVEDDDHKHQELHDLLDRCVAECRCEWSRSVRAAMMVIAGGDVDCIVLDMSLPVFDVSAHEDGLSHLPYGGRDILEFLDRAALRIPVVMVTAFDTFGEGPESMTLYELDAELRREYPHSYLGHVWYSPSVDGWKEQLLALINKLIGSKP